MSLPNLNRIVLLQVLTVFALLLAMTAAGLYAWNRHQLELRQLNDLEPRYARLAGLAESQADLKALGVRAKEQLTLLAYPSSQDVTQAGNDAQQRIRTIFTQNMLEVISIQVLPPGKDETKFDRIPINLRVEGDLAAFQKALAALSGQSPVVLVESLNVQTIGAVRPASIQRLGGQFSLFVLRVRS
jgi:general secretion pathway protein M